jgi:hypothetical protein
MLKQENRKQYYLKILLSCQKEGFNWIYRIMDCERLRFLKPYNIRQVFKKFICVCVIVAFAVTVWIAFSITGTMGPVQLEFDIIQNEEMILFSEFGEPPQFAIWLEDPKTESLKTVFVTYRTASNDWVGKCDCPDSLPLWSSIFQEDGRINARDTFGDSSFHAVTGATPREGHFKICAEVESDSNWNCFIEVNLAGDFNKEYQYMDEATSMIDTHHMGQPALIYRIPVIAVAGKTFEPKLYGMSVYNSDRGKIILPVKGITTAQNIFQNITIRVVKPEVK